jgi:hypothetical protein
MQSSEASFPKELTGHLTEVALGCLRMLVESPCNVPGRYERESAWDWAYKARHRISVEGDERGLSP